MEFKNPLKGKSTAVKVLVVLGIALLLIAVVYAATQLKIPSSGTILTSASLSANVTKIDWGNINAGDRTPINRDVTFTNTGEQPTVPLHLAYSTPVGGVTWTGEGEILGAGASVTYTITLTPELAPPAGYFEFDIIISG